MGKGSAGAFSEEQTEMYRECFKLMDIDKDGAINKNDLRAAFDNVGKILNDFENYLALLFTICPIFCFQHVIDRFHYFVRYVNV